MQASIGVILLQYIRSLATNHSLPFGALLAPIQASNVSFLWSLELWSAFTSKAFPTRRKIIFILVLPLAIIFGAVVGPSSAVAMIPRRVTSPLMDEVIVRTEQPLSLLFPAAVTDNLTATMNLGPMTSFGRTFVGDAERVAIVTEGYTGLVSEPRLLRLARGNCSDMNVGISAAPSQIGAIVMGQAAYKVNTFGGYEANVEQVFMVTELLQPVVISRCPAQNFRGLDLTDTESLLANEEKVQIPNQDGTGLRDFVTLGKLVSEALDGNTSFTKLSYTLWMDAPADTEHSWVNLAFATETRQTSMGILTVYSCTVDTFWKPTTYTRNYLAGAPVIESTPLIPTLLEQEGGCPDNQKILQDSSTIRTKVDPSFFGNNTRRIDSFLTRCGFDDLRLELGLAQCLAALTAQALSDLDPPRGTRLGADFVSDYMPLVSTPCEDCTNSSIRIYETGFGYGGRNSTVYLALTVLLIYCVLVFCHVGFSLVFGVCSTAWDSAASLVALALQSRKPTHLRHMGVDVHSMETFREMVEIRVNEREEVELVFVEGSRAGEPARTLKKIEANKTY